MFSQGTIWNPGQNTSIRGLLSNALLFVLFTGPDDIFRIVFLFFLGGKWILLNIIRLVFLGGLALPRSMTAVSCVIGVALFSLQLFLEETFFAREKLAGIEAGFCIFVTSVSDA